MDYLAWDWLVCQKCFQDLVNDCYKEPNEEEMTISAQFLNDSYLNGLDKESGIERTTENVRAFLKSRVAEIYPGLQIDDVCIRKVADRITIDYNLVAMIPRKMKFDWTITEQELLATDRSVTDLMDEELKEHIKKLVGEVVKSC
jgi:hypothetical protein